MKTAREIAARKSTGNLNVLPFLSLFTNCVVWTLYGVLNSDMTVIAPNATGILCGAYYTFVYAKYHPSSLVAQFAVAGTIVSGVAGLR